MKRKFLIVLNIVLLIILILELVVILLKLRQNLQQQTDTPQKDEKLQSPTPSLTPSTSILPPEVAPYLPWRVVDSNDRESIQNSNKDTLLYTRFGNPIQNINIAGKEWISTIEFNSDAERDKSQDFRDYYEKLLDKNGWGYDIKIDQTKTIKGVAADGPVGGIHGQLKTVGSSIQIVVFDYSIRSFVESKEFISPISCPCKYEYKVFISDPIPLAEVLKNYK
ncbi:MAG: hypothetical protein Q7T54_05040 [Candidatus Levybacteria bacterium]|nr:hypothetical protein [Candidatus Levybacteria bacterium]